MSQPSTGSSRAQTPQPLCPHRHGRRCRSVSLLGQVVAASWSTALHASSDRADAGVVGEQDAPLGPARPPLRAPFGHRLQISNEWEDECVTSWGFPRIIDVQ
jgi:hypothetical protein